MPIDSDAKVARRAAGPSPWSHRRAPEMARPAPTRPCAIGSRQIVEALTLPAGQRAYVHSREDGAANSRVKQKLDDHDLDVIVQVRKFGERFDFPFRLIAADCYGRLMTQ